MRRVDTQSKGSMRHFAGGRAGAGVRACVRCSKAQRKRVVVGTVITTIADARALAHKS